MYRRTDVFDKCIESKQQISSMDTLKQLNATENTLKAPPKIIQREYSCLCTKRQFEKIKEDKCKQMRSCRQREKSGQ